MDKIDEERKMGRLESRLSALLCKLFSHHWINLTVESSSKVGEQCMRCWKTRSGLDD
jgi:hypothetical protein